MTPFRVDVRNPPGAIVLALTGELDLATSPVLERELNQAFASTDREPVVIDLGALEFMDSTGLNVLVRAHQRADDSARRFGLIRGRPQVQRLLTLTGVSERIAVADSVSDLLDGN